MRCAQRARVPGENLVCRGHLWQRCLLTARVCADKPSGNAQLLKGLNASDASCGGLCEAWRLRPREKTCKVGESARARAAACATCVHVRATRWRRSSRGMPARAGGDALRVYACVCGCVCVSLSLSFVSVSLSLSVSVCVSLCL